MDGRHVDGVCLAKSLVETGTFDLRDQLTRFLRWRDEDTSPVRDDFGLGQQTFWALGDFATTGEIVWTSMRKVRSGNGSLMRLAPVLMAFSQDFDLAAAASAASSMTTHPTLECRRRARHTGG